MKPFAHLRLSTSARACAALGLASSLALLTACGGGGGSSGTDSSTQSASALSPTQSGAAAAVQTAVQGADASRRVSEVAAVSQPLAEVLLGNLVGAAQAEGRVHALASVNQDCASLAGTLASYYAYSGSTSGSGSVTINPVGSVFNLAFNNCTVTLGTTSWTLAGTLSLHYSTYTDIGNFQLVDEYDLSYSLTTGSYSSAKTLTGSGVCTFINGIPVCTDVLGNYTVSKVAVSTSGSGTTGVTTITSSVVKNGSLTATYSNWSYDATLGHATSGSVTVDDGLGNQAVITAGASAYAVNFTFGGLSSSYSVPY